MDLFTQNMINRTKQRQELLSRTKTPGSLASDQASVLQQQKNDGKENYTSSSCSKPSEANSVKKVGPDGVEDAVGLGLTSDTDDQGGSEPSTGSHASRKTRLHDLAHRISDWTDESAGSPKPTTTSEKRQPTHHQAPKKFSQNGSVTPSKLPGLCRAKADQGDGHRSPTKAVILDQSALICLTSQGFTASTSRSRLIYEFEKEQEGEAEEETAHSWTYASGTPVKGSLKPESPMALQVGNRLLNSPRTSPTVRGRQLAKQIPPERASSNILSPKTSSALSAETSTGVRTGAVADVPDNGPSFSVLKRVALFDSPRPSAKDPAELSVSERKAMFERNATTNSKLCTPAGTQMSSSSTESKRTPGATASARNKSGINQPLSAHRNAANAKAERMKELDQLRTRHEDRKERVSTQATRVSPTKNSNVVERPKTELQKSPGKEPYFGLHQVRPIRVSPPKPGKLYPCLSDIEMTTENESESDENEDQANSPAQSSPESSSFNVSQDLDSSFTVDILGKAGLSQFINTPKRKLREIDPKTEGLSHSATENSSTDAKGDADEAHNISDVLNEALGESGGADELVSSPPKQPKKDGRVAPAFEESEENAMPMYHSLSSYRQQQHDHNETGIRQVVRNPEPRKVTLADGAPQKNEANEASIQQKIRNLQEEIATQQNIITQASQALNLCRATAEFSGSTEQVEGERLLLVASQKRLAAMNEIQRLKTEAAMKKTSNDLASRGTLSLSNFTLPLKKDFVELLSRGGDDFIHYFIVLIRIRGQVIPLQMLSTGDGVQDGTLRFPNLVQLQDLTADFQVAVEVYALQTHKEKLDHEIKYHIRKESSKMRLTPKKLSGKQENRVSSKTLAFNTAGSTSIRSSSFGLVGFANINQTCLARPEWPLENVPPSSPIEGTLQIKVQCRTDSLIEERGFLTVFEDVGGFGAWHRRWCLLANDQLYFWKYPDDERRKAPLSNINLRKCITDHVDAVSHDVCARPNTFLLVTTRQPQSDDKDSLVMTCHPHRTALRHLISADLKQERHLWCSQLNRALANLRAWDTDAQRALLEGTNKD